MSTRTLGKSAGGGGRFATGSYTGDGNATQAIVGVGFRPKVAFIYPHADTVGGDGTKTDNDGINASFWWAGGLSYQYWNDDIISLDVDGFTVGDGSTFVAVFNILGRVYTYYCFG